MTTNDNAASRRSLLALGISAMAFGAVSLLTPRSVFERLFNVRPSAPATKEGVKAPNFTLIDQTGGKVQLADYNGRVVLLNFWATWCNPCRREIPWFTDFQREYKDRGFTVLGVALDDAGWKPVRPFIASMKVNYPIMLGDEAISHSYGDMVALPTTFIIGRNGKVKGIHTGLIPREQYETEIETELATDVPAGH